VEILAEAAFSQLIRWKSGLPKRTIKAPREHLLLKIEETTMEEEISLSSTFPISLSILCKLFRELVGIYSSGLRRQGDEETQDRKSASKRNVKRLS